MWDVGVGIGGVWGEEVGLLRAVTLPGLEFAGKAALASRGTDKTRKPTCILRLGCDTDL
jgi:hypothetical protein